MELFVDIKKKFGKFNLDVTFETTKEPLGLLGASGSGKSMILKCIAGLEKPDSGKIILNGEVLFDSEKKINLPIKQRKVGFLFQNYALFPHMTVYENIKFAVEPLKLEEPQAYITEIIQNMHLSGLEKRYPSELSGGQQQRVAIARALATKPDILLLDEPFSALDNYLRSQMEKQLIEILANYDGNTIFVTHNMNEAYRICKNLMIISDGKKIAYGEKNELFLNPPNITSARLTGCKNFSRIKMSSMNNENYNIIEAIEWGCLLAVKRRIDASLKFVCIRANHISMKRNDNVINTLPCRVVGTSETPFRVMVYLKPDNESSGELLWDISKEKWLEIKEIPEPWNICMDVEKVFVVGEN